MILCNDICFLNFKYFRETIPLRDIITCKKITSWYSNSKYYFEIVCQKRQVYRLDTLKACEKWIEVINSSIIYEKFWFSLIQKNPQIYDYYWNQKEEVESVLDIPENSDKNNNQNQKEKNENKNENENSTSENTKKNNTSSNISNETSSGKKKERRRNPYSMVNGNLSKIKFRI